MLIPRRVVTGVRDGKSVVLHDGSAPNAHVYSGWPGHMTSLIWATAASPDIPVLPGHAMPPACPSILPGPGETRLLIVRFPPDTIFMDPLYDPVRLQAELDEHMPGFAGCFEPAHPGMHRTDSIDYDLVMEGEVWLELDDGEQIRLKQGDVVVQGGGRHAWRNKSDGDAVMAFVLIGARRTE